jgi:DNA-binding CsgD family transcriptional regulator
VLLHLDGHDGARAAVRRYLERFPATRDTWEQAGLVCDQVRVLVCDGPSLLSWVGAFRPDAFTDRESRLLQALVPALRDRLRLERQLGQVSLALAALPAVLDRIGAPAFVAGTSGQVALANASARAQLERDRGELRAVLSAEIAARGPDRYAVTRLSLPGCPAWFLCVERERPPDPGLRAAAFAARYGLTDRQAEVVALAARGLANKTIAAHLRCAESTVEMHLTAAFAQTQVESRSALVARFWRPA